MNEMSDKAGGPRLLGLDPLGAPTKGSQHKREEGASRHTHPQFPPCVREGEGGPSMSVNRAESHPGMKCVSLTPGALSL